MEGINKNDFINILSKRIIEGRAALFVGAGISVGSGNPSWDDLMKPIADELKLDIDKEYDLFQLAEYYVRGI